MAREHRDRGQLHHQGGRTDAAAAVHARTGERIDALSGAAWRYAQHSPLVLWGPLQAPLAVQQVCRIGAMTSSAVRCPLLMVVGRR